MSSVYQQIDKPGAEQYGLTLDIRDQLTNEAIRFIVSFIMLPAYLRNGQQPVINLAGKRTALLDAARDSLQSYFREQAVNDAIINKLVFEQGTGDYFQIIAPGPFLQQEYHSILQREQYYGNPLFILTKSKAEIEATHALLESEEAAFAKNFPKLVAMAKTRMALEKRLYWAGVKHQALEQELKNQQDYNALLRTDHSTRELQEYYNNEYEILPTWYKRFGHILKVLTGKRYFRSLFRDDVKKYKQ